MDKVYLCIDLKSFYASCECVERGLDPFTTNLVVADPDRESATVCLAITPAMKKLGIKNRCRVFEIPKNVDYIMAKPRMNLYMDKSAEIYSVYLQYVSPEDIHIYSIDECFFDITDYVKIYKTSAVGMAKMLMDAVYKKTGIRATAGIGTNLFLAKVALDITAKNAPDFLGYLDEEEFKKTIWHHRPITDVWNIGKGIANRLSKYGIFDLYGVAHYDEDILYKEFGINAELLIDHAKGIETCTIRDIHEYKTKSNSISNGQVLFSNYSFDDATIILKEMVDGICLELIDRSLVTNNISLSVGYAGGEKFTGGSFNLGEYTNSVRKIKNAFLRLYDKTTDKNTPIKRVNVGLNNVVDEIYKTVSFFTDEIAEKRENDIEKTVIGIKRKFGKNAILKGIDFDKRATAIERNKTVGGHNAGENE